MRVNFSFSLTDEYLIQKVKEFKESGGNLSGLISALLKNYFEGEISIKQFSKELLKVKELYNELLEYKEKFEEWEKRLKELEQLLQEKEEKKREEKYQPLIKKLREQVFDDLEDLLNNRRVNPAHAIKVRLSVFASENNISLPEAKQLFFKAFPEYNGHLKSVLGGEL